MRIQPLLVFIGLSCTEIVGCNLNGQQHTEIEICSDQLDEAGLQSVADIRTLEHVNVWVEDFNSAADKHRARIQSIRPDISVEALFMPRHGDD